MILKGVRIGFAVTGSFCTFAKIIPQVENLVNEGAEVIPIISESVNLYDTRFNKAEDFKNTLQAITGKQPINSIVDAEPIGPKALLDILVIAPCTGNTISKIANAITDSSVTMACKAHLRNMRPVVIAVSTNDGLGANAKNIGILLNMKNIYMVPFGQDDPIKKCTSLVADFDQILPTILNAQQNCQIQPILVCKKI
ncbi:dipicolinate synthase subunit B [Ruminiclostridium cellobioparum]|jgi:dipicolinate synthase subunit B|uniref:Dipicolinic acid synthetase, B subunit n=1 Tax=Ruminiclostridium cellobioparum subsp. termitidis CT1112 TaxID=1195236 RepID=S0FMS6_RUMCE|nr:dipicolinate synthase subunit B [Ruminiclostridium cellobioparum]EMS73202.1 dipicolinic acid synthetase, B subunit [Ruminiclostridium cellobioparum subsp. termitidis CT1112]